MCRLLLLAKNKTLSVQRRNLVKQSYMHDLLCAGGGMLYRVIVYCCEYVSILNHSISVFKNWVTFVCTAKSYLSTQLS